MEVLESSKVLNFLEDYDTRLKQNWIDKSSPELEAKLPSFCVKIFSNIHGRGGKWRDITLTTLWVGLCLSKWVEIFMFINLLFQNSWSCKYLTSFLHFPAYPAASIESSR